MKRLLIYGIVLLINFSTAFSQSVAVGGVQFADDFNIFKTNNPLAFIIRDSVCSAGAKPTKNGYKLDIIEGIRQIKSGWELKLKPFIKFSDGSQVKGQDYVDSIKRCNLSGAFSGLKAATSQDLRVQLDFVDQVEYESLVADLADCRLIHTKTADLFSNAFGEGTNVLCAGNYFISDYRKGAYYQLKKSVSGLVNLDAPDVIDVKAVGNNEEGLRLVRIGKLLLFFTEDEAVLERGQKDPTLKTGVCSGFRWVARHDFGFDCEAGWFGF